MLSTIILPIKIIHTIYICGFNSNHVKPQLEEGDFCLVFCPNMEDVVINLTSVYFVFLNANFCSAPTNNKVHMHCVLEGEEEMPKFCGLSLKKKKFSC